MRCKYYDPENTTVLASDCFPGHGSERNTCPGPFGAAGEYMKHFLIVGLLLCLCGAGSAMTLVGTLGNGPSFDIVEHNGYVYAAQGCEVRVYPVSNDLTWRSYVSRVKFNTEIYGLDVAGNTLYVASNKDLGIVDITDPRNPVTVSTFHTTSESGIIRDVKIEGTCAYLAVNGAGIQVVNVADPAHPVAGSLVKLTGYNTVMRITTGGNYLYAALAGDKRMDILDITDPSRPAFVSSFAPADASATGFSSVAVRGDYAYLVEYYTSVRVVDASNRKSPVQVSTVTGVNANDIKVMGDYAYVSIRYQGFNIYNIANPGTMVLAGQGTGFAGYIEGIYPTARYTFVSGDSFGFSIFDTSDAARPRQLVTVPTLGGVDSVVADSDFLYVGAHNYGTWVIDIRNKTNPQEVTVIKNDGRNTGIDVDRGLLVFAGAWSGLNIADISDPSNPRPVALKWGDNIVTVLADGNYLYTSVGIVDISNPANPVYVSKSPYFYGRMKKLDSTHLIVAVSEYYSPKGIHIIDVSHKANPKVIATYGNGTAYYDVDVVGKTMVGLSGYDMETVDITDITRPSFISRVAYAGTWVGYSLNTVGPVVYATGGPMAVRAVDVSDPAHIVQVDTGAIKATSAYCQESCIRDGYLYTGNKWGIDIFALGTPASVTSTPATSPRGVPAPGTSNAVAATRASTVPATAIPVLPSEMTLKEWISSFISLIRKAMSGLHLTI